MFDLKKFNTVYYPTISNEPLKILVDCDLDDEDGYPVRLISQSDTFTLDGKYHGNDKNPVLFPYSQEWYDKLKIVYPDLEPYKDDNKELLNLLEQQVDSVACRVSRTSYEEACKNGYVVFKNMAFEGSFTYFVPVNPYTLEPCKTVEDYFKTPSDKE